MEMKRAAIATAKALLSDDCHLTHLSNCYAAGGLAHTNVEQPTACPNRDSQDYPLVKKPAAFAL